MAHRVSFHLEPKVQFYVPDSHEHLVAADAQSEALIASAIALQEKTSHLWETYQQVLSNTAIKNNEEQKLPHYEQLHTEVDETLNQLHHLIKCKYPDLEKIEAIKNELLKSHSTLLELLNILNEEKIISKALSLASTRYTLRKHYKENIQPRFRNLTKEAIESYKEQNTQLLEEGKRVKSALESLKTLDSSKEEKRKEAHEEMSRYVYQINSLLEALDFQKDIAFMKGQKQTISYLPLGTLHEVEPRESGGKRFRIAGFFGN